MFKALKTATFAVACITVGAAAGIEYKNIFELPVTTYNHNRTEPNNETFSSFLLAQAKSLALEPEHKPVPPEQSDIQARLYKRWLIMQHGYPTLDNVKQYDDHVLAYSNIHRAPLWVCEHITPDSITSNENINRANSKFKPDQSIHPFYRASNTDYLNSGYDRGHLAASANHRQSQTAMNETFYLTNICPQTGKGLNRSKWNDLEKRGRTLARKNGNVHILSGPLYLPTVVSGEKFVKYKLIGENNIAVPTHFFKVILATDQKGVYHLESYVMPNEEIRDDLPISTFLVPKEAVEKGAGFHIFENVPASQIKSLNGVNS